MSRQVNRTKSCKRQCVTFDLWETLIFDEPEKDEARGRMRYEGVQAVLAAHGIKLAMEALKRGYEESGPRLQAVWDRNEEVPIIDQIGLVVKLAAGRPVVFDPSWAKVLEAAYVDPILSIPPKLNADAPGVLEAIRNRGYKIGLISNTGRSPGHALRQLLDTYGVLKFFDAMVFSNEVRCRKPDRTIFDRAAHLLSAENEAIVHVGDSPEADFWGAKNAGMHAILLDQTPPDSSQWAPHSLFALARASRRMTAGGIEQHLRIKSLTETLNVVDSLLPRAP
jgi:putative hydrolase of the HAD superfamily